MLASERRKKILSLIQEEGVAKVSYLSTLFEVSEPTIRQDLEVLDREGYIIREHGGAFLKSMSQQVQAMTLQHMDNIDKKRDIAKKAVEFVKDGDVIILDSGSTTTEIAHCLVDRNQLTVITNALNIALILGSSPGITVHVTGGEFKAPTLSLTGETAAHFFDSIHVDLLFLATGGISSRYQLTYPGFQDIPVKKAMISSAKKTLLVADSTKFGDAALATLGSISEVHGLITDKSISSVHQEELKSRGVEVVLA